MPQRAFEKIPNARGNGGRRVERGSRSGEERYTDPMLLPHLLLPPSPICPIIRRTLPQPLVGRIPVSRGAVGNEEPT